MTIPYLYPWVSNQSLMQVMGFTKIFGYLGQTSDL